MDFEKANWNAIKEYSPGTIIKGCLFHYNQAIYRNLQKLRLQNSYNNDATLTKIARCVMALPLLPHEHIEHVYNMVPTMADTPQLIKFMDLVNKQWITSLIHILLSLSVFGMSNRTNNASEGYHNRLQVFSQDNLSIYKLIDFLANETKLVECNITLISLEN